MEEIETSASSITKSLTDAFSSPVSAESSSLSNGSFSDGDSINTTSESSYSIWSVISAILIILIIWVLIFNLFNLGKITTWIESFLNFIGYSTGETIKTTANVGATGLTGGTNVAAGTVTGGVNILEKGLHLTPEEKNRAQTGNQTQQTTAPLPPRDSESDILSTGLANLKKMTPLPDDATSVTQSGGRSKSGYCYIGEDRGFRSCIKVGENDSCISGDIFPTMDICINPNLRT